MLLLFADPDLVAPPPPPPPPAPQPGEYLPEMRPWAAELYGRMDPLVLAEDPYHSYSAARFIIAFTDAFEEIRELARDTTTTPGWGKLMSPDTIPDKGLDWLSQFVGVTSARGATAEQKRADIRRVAGWRRGSPGAIIAAVQEQLTGTKSVTLVERDGSAYQLGVITLAEETPDDTAVLRAILSQKPAGIVLSGTVLSGQTWQELLDNNSTWDDVDENYTTWNDALLNNT